MKALVGLVLVAAVGAGAWFFFLKPVALPEVTLQAADESSVTLSQIRADRDLLLLVVLMPNDPASKFSLDQMRPFVEKYPKQAAFVGLVWGHRAAAEQLREEWQIPFDVYGVRDAPDPYAINGLIEAVGVSHGTRAAVHGGTLVAIGPENKLLFHLALEDVKQLPDKMAEWGY
jgi:hypothetical protein